MDALLIADYARVGRTRQCEPWRGGQYLSLNCLIKRRLHLAECIGPQKNHMVSNLHLKSSELQFLEGEKQPFSNAYGATASAVTH